MSSDIENLTEKTTKLSIDPVYNTNWCDIPAEIKLKCIGKLEFKERLSLRRTAKAERSLVDLQKIDFNYGYFWKNEGNLIFYVKTEKISLSIYNRHEYSKRFRNENEALIVMKHIWRIGVFEYLKISFVDSFTHNEEFMNFDGLFNAKEINIERCHSDNLLPILQKLKNGVESILMNVDGGKVDSFDKILAFPQVRNSRSLRFRNYNQTDSLYKIAQKWIDKNSKIESAFLVSVYEKEGSFEEFLEHFDDRIVSNTGKRVRICTNNPDRHILLERGLDDVVDLDCTLKYFRLSVISAEMNESEYDDNVANWVFDLDPTVYDSCDLEEFFEQYQDMYGYSHADDTEYFFIHGRHRIEDSDTD
ncbi:hypothetical protein B9Z55_012797 [Caenorhabditis nigoni]|uniref:F-box domain-containing protein n=1 Tax=Caenorhabditis nigoni TaxID=1611254 RepID=A0A2G5TZ17_9PELO|nr:hypothetical protein B9Z55_012797 [Caenorhabditis nigoni]